MNAVAVRVAFAILAVLLAGGCDDTTAMPDEIDGSKVATMAERELEAENPRIAAGTLACPDLDLQVGASVSCLRTSELSEGRVVKVNGTVEVTSRSAGGRLHVAMDDQASEFGVAGDHLAADLRGQYVRLFRIQPTRLDCPYLRGAVGTVVACRIEVAGTRREVEVVVTSVDPGSYRTTYVARNLHAAS
jgi:hypothetical protein